MPKYKDLQSNVHHLDDESFVHLLPAGCVQISEEEAVTLTTPPLVPKTPEQVQKEFTDAIQEFMDHQAMAHGYDNIKSAAIRAGYPGPFHDEGVKFATWMDECWVYGYAVLANVKSGQRTIPTVTEIIAELPPLVL